MQYLEGMEAFSYRLLTTVLGWKLEEVQVFNAKVTQEIKSNKVHAYYTLWVLPEYTSYRKSCISY